WRWARRNRTAVASATVALLAGLVGLGAVAAVQARANVALERANDATNQALLKTQHAEAQARGEADQAQAVNDFLTEDLLGQADPDVSDREKKVTVEELLHRAARRIDGNPKF